jgi:RND family efflux transporter MFP subunit
VYERDFQAVSVGVMATVTFPAYPALTIAGKVSYIAPAVNPDTRTAQLRVEVPNSNGQLKLGMLSELSIVDGRQPRVIAIPRSAVQTVGDRTVVYVSDPSYATRLTERFVILGAATGDHVAVVSGLREGESIVVQGSFAVRAELERMSPRQSPPAPAASAASGSDGPQIVRVPVAAE